MEAYPRTLDEIFGPTIHLRAPLFQRPYVWKRDANWVPLWSVIRGAAELRLQQNVGRPHFLGAIVLNQLSTPTGGISAREIIDGQQRLTTLQICLVALRDLCGASQ